MNWRDDSTVNNRYKAGLFALFIVAATFIAYHPAWRGGFIWDDDDYVTENPLLTAPDGLRRIWFSLESPSQYFPLTYTTFFFERSLWGLNPAVYHLVNLLLHAANALLVWRVLGLLRVPGAWLAAAIFALHPVQVESVAWITERKNVLMGLFFLLSLWAWIRFIDSEIKRRWYFYMLSLILYAMALAAKTTACTLPAALLLILWLKKNPINWRRMAQIVPFVALGIGMGLVTVWWERNHQGTQGQSFAIGPVDRILIASRAMWFYLGKLIWPVNLMFSYPRWNISASNPLAYGWLLATVALGAAIWRLRQRGVQVAALFFAVTLSPVLGFIMLYTFLYSFAADHYQYLACIGPIALAAAGISQLRRATVYIAAAILAVLGLLTWEQSSMYADSVTLWKTTLRQNPTSWMAENNLGDDLSQQGKLDEAIAHYRQALAIKPDYAEALYNLGISFRKQGHLNETIEEYQKALALRPNYADAHYNLGNALVQEGHLAEAVEQYAATLKLAPNNPGADYNIATALMQLGHPVKAIPHFRKAVEINPNNVDAHYNLANLSGQSGHTDEAVEHFQKALKLRPGFAEAEDGLGNCFSQIGRQDEAIIHYRNALAIKPDYPEAQKALAWILATSPQASLRNGKEAVALAERAGQLSGGRDPFVLVTLAAARAEDGQFDQAIMVVQKAISLAQSTGQANLVAQLNAQLGRYQAGLPLHQ